jgi:uncharacterized protein (TIGR03437 family)
VSLLGTGFGVTKPLAEAGKKPAGEFPVVAPVTMTISGQNVPVLRAVLYEGFDFATVRVEFVVPLNAQIGTLPVVITVGGVTSNKVFLPVAPPTPTISGIANSASGATAIASGSWVAIYGANLARTTRTWQDSDFEGKLLPAILDGVSVKINNKAASVFFISPGQINVQAPADSAIGPVLVAVTNDGGNATANSNLQTYSPAFFTFNNKYPAAVHPDRFYVAPANYFGPGLASRPAKPGDVIIVFGTGFGPTNPAAPPGQIFSGAPPLSNPALLRIMIGGVTAAVQFAGIVAPGEYQFNVVVPELLDGDYPFVATIAGLTSQSGLVLPVRR